MKRSHFGILFLSGLFAASCGGGSSSGGGGGAAAEAPSSLTIQLTDAPFENWMVLEANVEFTALRLTDDPSGSGEYIDLMPNGHTSDLTKLTNGVTELMVNTSVPPGTYREARVQVANASVLLVNGRRYATDDGTLTIGGLSPLGYQIPLDPPLVAQDGAPITALLDFDLSKSFRPIPADDPLNADSVILLPSVRCVDMKHTGEIRGVVEEMNPQGQMVGVENAFVYLLPPGEIDIEQRIATTSTEADGSFVFLGVVPEPCDIAAYKGGEDREFGLVVEVGHTTQVDLELE